ncbi:Mbeg1-like protein [Butyrivibrio sp. VCB2006]|uniref:Mbeg1-like protein n=1 Tax=Butyrivibrio sp. VCB2006 TaxID=1280679 RepID=UPI000404BDC7|nr:Mbeg1-like protein [Butyrivibrio sp. VCB2006]
MSSSLSLEEIVLINNLLYCENLGGPKGTFLSPVQESKTIGDYVNGVLRKAAEIIDDKEYSSGVTGAEYKEILWSIKPNEHLRNIIIRQIHYESEGAGGGRSAYLFDPSSNEAIIAFKGTQSDAEWIDNVSGLYQVPTEFQNNALNWFQSLDFTGCETITVTGHSKGGNKSKFITIMDDRVDNCFSFDGQGFSDEFIKRYVARIIKNKGKITNIIAESDFVNILLNDVGARQFYLGTNYGRLGFAENHCANAVLFFDSMGAMTLWRSKGQDKKMMDLDIMLNSFIRTYKMDVREKVANMLGNIIVCAKSGDTDRIADTFIDERYMDSAADLLAYILRYKTEKPQMIANVREILKQNGFNTNMLGVIDFVTNHDLIIELIGKNKKAMIAILKKKHVKESLVSFLEKHIGLFDFIVLVAQKMRKIDPLKYSGADLEADDAEKDMEIKGRHGISRRKLSLIVAGAVLAIVILIVLILVIL